MFVMVIPFALQVSCPGEFSMLHGSVLSKLLHATEPLAASYSSIHASHCAFGSRIESPVQYVSGWGVGTGVGCGVGPVQVGGPPSQNSESNGRGHV